MTQDEIIEAAIQGHASTRDAIRWAMNQEQGEPVGWISQSGALYRTRLHAVANGEQLLTPLYTTPQQRTWVGLTHEEHMKIMTGSMTTSSRMAAVEAKLKKKNT